MYNVFDVELLGCLMPLKEINFRHQVQSTTVESSSSWSPTMFASQLHLFSYFEVVSRPVFFFFLKCNIILQALYNKVEIHSQIPANTNMEAQH